MKFFDMLCF